MCLTLNVGSNILCARELYILMFLSCTKTAKFFYFWPTRLSGIGHRTKCCVNAFCLIIEVAVHRMPYLLKVYVWHASHVRKELSKAPLL